MLFTSKYTLLTLSFFINICVLFSQNDTLKIQEVSIIEEAPVNISNTENTLIDSVYLQENEQGSLSSILSKHSPLFIKNYGQGSLSSSSYRGANSAHSSVLWNGISISSPMLGQSDFSLIPNIVIDEINFEHGVNSFANNSGNFGANIILKNSVNWNNKQHIEINYSMQSYNTQNASLSYTFGNSKTQYKTKIFFQSSDNDFKYLNTVLSQKEFFDTRQSSAYQQYGLVQEFHHRINKSNQVSVILWGQNNYREIPVPIIISQINDNENQQNNFLRLVANWEHSNKKSILKVTNSFLYDNFIYTNKISNINSKNLSNTFVNNINYSHNLKQDFTLKTGFSSSLSKVESNNYDEAKNKTFISTFISLNKKINNYLNINFVGKQYLNIITKKTIQPKLFLPAIKINYRLFRGKDIFMNFSALNDFHFPTLNDLYWYPGGNVDLLPEEISSYEISFIQKIKHNNFEIDANTNIFYNNISNWISWFPDSNGRLWTPQNIKDVNTKGFEISINSGFKIIKLKNNISVNYSYTKATNLSPISENDNSINKQLIYVPINQFNVYYRLTIKGFNLSYNQQFTGKRYITSDNYWEMPYFNVAELLIGKNFKIKKQRINFHFKINNIWNVNYQAIAYYPMPRRTYSIGLKYIFNK